ncbi:hypothetical protein NSK_000632 [Nannochloropsis salina CCMP1776]|uniref:Crossover junction endonuclease MUS81 n=1 Tax=Nannochloropsis salina CCMP1776 TaxID=1027361 RepID=A0A4D9DDT9_9STRA|nr:hypothetical protein NSK_000632 [Nannochloropsis salina CCMP1776]|eukprot:TFJ88283.1 hypothetical protein NSK_000632 [Nannochloropsis salina CCMP1776]
MEEDASSIKVWNNRLVAYVKTLELGAARRGSQLRYTYKSVAKALAKHPTRVTTAEEARQLKGVGPTIGRQLENFIVNTLHAEAHAKSPLPSDRAKADDKAVSVDEASFSVAYLDEMMEDLLVASQTSTCSANTEAQYPLEDPNREMGSKPDTWSTRVDAPGRQSTDLSDANLLVVSDDESHECEGHGREEEGGKSKENLNDFPGAIERSAPWSSQEARRIHVVDVSDGESDGAIEGTCTGLDEGEEGEGGRATGGEGKDIHEVVGKGGERQASGSSSPRVPDGKGRKRKFFSRPEWQGGVEVEGVMGKGCQDMVGGRWWEESKVADVQVPSSRSLLDRLEETFGGTRPEEWEVVALLDRVEHENNPSIEATLLQAGIRCEVRVLRLADVLWVARRRAEGRLGGDGGGRAAAGIAVDPGDAGGLREGGHPTEEEEEIMLRYMIERKTVPDLASSIKDGRYREQKGRMLGVGREIDRAFYLVEGRLEQLNDMIRPAALRTALISTQVVHGMPVLQTASLDQTIALLQRMHTRISHEFAHFLQAACGHNRLNSEGDLLPATESFDGLAQSERLSEYLQKHSKAFPLPASRIIRLAEYQHLCRKTVGNLSVRAMFTAQLCAIDKVSEAKSKAVVNAYSTPSRLARAMQSITEEEAVAALAVLPVPGQRQSLGRVAATNIYHVYR